MKLFHADGSHCLRTANIVHGENPPKDYYPCEHCFPVCTKKRKRSFSDLNRLNTINLLKEGKVLSYGLLDAWLSGDETKIIVRYSANLVTSYLFVPSSHIDEGLRCVGLPRLAKLKQMFPDWEETGDGKKEYYLELKI
jgi:hypothetical protein